MEINGEDTGYVSVLEKGRDTEGYLSLLLHECFHCFQKKYRKRDKGGFGETPEADPVYSALIGLESPTEAGLSGVEMRNDWKLKHFPDYRESIRTIQSHGVTVNGCFVLGLDGHTPDVFDQVFEFVRNSELYEVQATILTPFPGTPLYEQLEQQGRMLAPEQWQRCTLFDVNYQPANMSPTELAEGFKRLVVKLYSDEFTKARRGRFKEIRRAYCKQKGLAS